MIPVPKEWVSEDQKREDGTGRFNVEAIPSEARHSLPLFHGIYFRMFMSFAVILLIFCTWQ